MSAFKEYEQYDALGLAELVRRGEVTPSELLEAAISRADALNPRLNALIHRFDQRAREQCQQLENGPFTGVPFVLKDLLATFEGEPLTKGSRAVNWVPDHDSELVQRYREAGLVMFAKTNLPELGLTITTEPKAHGPCHNPWMLGRSPGGSSGGSAAAVAARIVPMAQADDGGGSIRFPAACCGLFGLKPSRGRNPLGPDLLDSWDGAVAAHAVTLSVRDSAALLDATHGPEAGSLYWLPEPETSFLDAVEHNEGKLRIGFTTQAVVEAQLHPEAHKGLTHTLKLLESLGHEVEEVSLPIDQSTFWAHFMTIVAAHSAAEVVHIERHFGADAVKLLEPTTLQLAKIGRSLSACDLVLAKQAWHKMGQAMDLFHLDYDLLLTPTLTCPPVAHGELVPKPLEELGMRISTRLPIGKLLFESPVMEQLARPTFEKMAFTVLANVTGQPSMSVPLHWTDDGLPLGMMFTAAMGNEEGLLNLAGALEQAAPWRQRRPSLLSTVH